VIVEGGIEMATGGSSVSFCSGLDLGPPAAFSALAILERTLRPDPGNPEKEQGHYAVRHLERFAVGTPYPDIATCVAGVVAQPPLAGSRLLIDQTGVGHPVIQFFRRPRIDARIQIVTIPNGQGTGRSAAGGWCIPKQELVSVLQVLLQGRRIQVAPTLPEAQTLVRELMNFRMKVPASTTDTLESWREGRDDDLVFAVAIAAWAGERASRKICIFA
jgi:hypothetical protein